MKFKKFFMLLSVLAILMSAVGFVPLYMNVNAAASPASLCEEKLALCAETLDPLNYEGEYVGHDEPSLLFYSNTPGSGNSNVYRLTLPTDPPTLPTQDGTGGTFNFQLHPAFWLGMALCDNQSAPEYTHNPCTPNSDANIFDGSDPSAADYIGHHPGTAFLELQFYPPGWTPWPAGISCDASQWCAAMAIFSLNQDQNAGVLNNAACLGTVGLEPANFAFITKSGTPHGPPSPLGLTFGSFTPDPNTDLFMNSGDELVVDIHDTANGLQVSIDDKTTHQHGSMTASAANGFAQIIFDPNATTCSESPYDFHSMYATSSEHTRVPWAAHSYNVAFSDEIGHFEYCDAIDPTTGQCTSSVNDPGGPDDDDFGCFYASQSLFVPIGGCIATDNDFDGVSYQTTWPGSLSNRKQDRLLNPSPIIFTSPLFRASDKKKDLQNYNRIAFEADLPRIEAADFGGICNRTTGAGCVNPPPGSNFYPIFTTRGDKNECQWQFGGTNIPGTQNTFGGNSTAEYGPLSLTVYPTAAGPSFRYNNFRQILNSNPCLAK